LIAAAFGGTKEPLVTASSAHYPCSAPIDAYGNGGFRFAGMSHRGSILCLPSGIYAWDVSGIDDLGPAHLARALAAPEERVGILLLGTGTALALPSAEVREACQAAGVALEIMQTGAAARTYNVLLAEGRSVGAALIAVE
jgi:uncharacterized protein